MHAYSNTDFQDPTTFQFQVHSLNRIIILLILQLQTDYFSSSFISEKSHSKQRHYTVFTETETSFYMQKTKSSLILHTEGKETFTPEKKFYTQKARRSLSTSNHLTRPSKGIPAVRHSKSIPDIPVIHDIQPFQAILHTSRDSTLLQHSSTRMHILHFDWFPQKLHRVPVEILQTLHSSKKGRCCIISRNGHALQNRILASFCLVK